MRTQVRTGVRAQVNIFVNWIETQGGDSVNFHFAPENTPESTLQSTPESTDKNRPFQYC